MPFRSAWTSFNVFASEPASVPKLDAIFVATCVWPLFSAVVLSCVTGASATDDVAAVAANASGENDITIAAASVRSLLVLMASPS